MKRKLKAIIQTGITVILLCGIWQMLEYIAYSEMDLLEKIEELWEREDIDHEEE